MHTSNLVDDEGRHWVVHHNGDFSGEIMFSFRLDDLETYDAPAWPEATAAAEEYARADAPSPIEKRVSVQIPFVLMKELVGRYLIDAQISRLEDVTGAQLVDAFRLPRAELD